MKVIHTVLKWHTHSLHPRKGSFTKVLQYKGRLSICGNGAESTNGTFSISIVPQNKAIFGLSALGFCQKV